MAKEWEYLVIRLDLCDENNMKKRLINPGEEGWELVSVVGWQSFAFAFFKREKP